MASFLNSVASFSQTAFHDAVNTAIINNNTTLAHQYPQMMEIVNKCGGIPFQPVDIKGVIYFPANATIAIVNNITERVTAKAVGIFMNGLLSGIVISGISYWVYKKYFCD